MAMKREHVFWLLMLIGIIAIPAAGIELYVRYVVDDGMQFDLEMWKYARDVKQVSADPLIGHEHAPNRQARLMGVDFRTNSKGLRDREIPYERTAATPRILMLGDSFTEGWGVAIEQTFSKRIERLYAAQGVAAEAINAGVGNYNTTMEASWFIDEGFKYRPDIVVLNFVQNDAEPVPPHTQPGAWLRACYACVFLAGRFDVLSRDVSLRPDWKDYYLSLYGDGDAAGWRAAKAAIATLAAYCRSHRITLLIVNFPELHELKPYPLQRITDFARQAAAENGAEFLDLLPDLRDQNPASLWVSPTDPHPNGRANELIANAIFRKLQTIRIQATE
jgi:lysophospholipase L1-like esterase